MLKKFKEGDLFTNTVRAHPQSEFIISNGVIHYDRVTGGEVRLNEFLTSSVAPYPFITKDGTMGAFKTVTTTAFGEFQYGSIITGNSYPQTIDISSHYNPAGSSRGKMTSLKNTLNYYAPLSRHYSYSSSLGDKSSQALRLVELSALHYGSSIKKGSIACKFYLTGTLIAELKDENRNGELIQVGPQGSPGSGSVAGVVLYREGFLVLTGSWDLHDSYTDNFVPETTASVAPAWRHFLTTGSSGIDLVPSSSFAFDFQGTQDVQVITMFTHAPKGELNHSNNPTYIQRGQIELRSPFTSSNIYRERDNLEIVNTSKTPWTETSASFEKITYISKIGIYDNEQNLIAIAKVATPVRKKEADAYSFKLKLDI